VRRVRRLVPLAAAVLALLCAASGSALASARFYTPSYGSGPPEEIGGFELGDDGSLTPLAASPFPAEKAGTGGLLGLAFAPDGERAASAFLFTGGVQGYGVPASGIFTLRNSIATASGTGIAITPDGRFAFMPTRDSGPSAPAEGVRGFSVAPDGTLASLAPSGSSGESYEVAITPDGRFLYTAAGGKIAGYAIGPNGSLASIGGTEALAQHLGTSPDGRFLFAETHESLRTFAIGVGGHLSAAGPPLLFSAPSLDYFGIAPDGSHVYVPDYNNDQIYEVAIAADGTPSLAGKVAVENPEMVSVSPDGRFLVYFRGGGPDYGLGVAAIGPGGAPTLLPSFVPWSTGEAEPLVFQPRETPVARFSATVSASGVESHFDAGGSERAVRYDWDFGDGTTLANGGPAPSHVFAQPGDYRVTLTVTDAQGCSATRIYTGQSTVCPGGGAARATFAASVEAANVTFVDSRPGNVRAGNVRPVFGYVRVRPRRFAPRVRGVEAGKVELGTRFSYYVSEDATVRFKIERKQGKRFRKLGSRSQAAKQGPNALAWNGRLHGKPLPPGAYRATTVATDREGGRSAPKTIGFRILPLPPPR
jgi:PKD repeat protein